MAEPKDVIIAVFGATVEFAGLLLVFIALVYSKSEGMDSSRRADRYRLVAKLGLIPFLLSIACAWICLEWLKDS